MVVERLKTKKKTDKVSEAQQKRSKSYAAQSMRRDIKELDKKVTQAMAHGTDDEVRTVKRERASAQHRLDQWITEGTWSSDVVEDA